METFTLLRNAHLFHNISDTDLPSMLSCLQSTKKTFPKESIILNELDRTEEMGVVLSGMIHIVRYDFWGNRTIVSSIGPGGTFAETIAFTQSPSEVVVVTAEEATILFLNIHKILHTCNKSCQFHNQLIENLVHLFAYKNLELLTKINHITKRTTRDKLLSYLSTESKRQGGARTFTIVFDRQHLADYLCVERSAMSSELGKMRDEGLVEYHKSTFTLIEEV